MVQKQFAEIIDIDEHTRFVVNKTFRNGPRKTYSSTWKKCTYSKT